MVHLPSTSWWKLSTRPCVVSAANSGTVSPCEGVGEDSREEAARRLRRGRLRGKLEADCRVQESGNSGGGGGRLREERAACWRQGIASCTL